MDGSIITEDAKRHVKEIIVGINAYGEGKKWIDWGDIVEVILRVSYSGEGYLLQIWQEV